MCFLIKEKEEEGYVTDFNYKSGPISPNRVVFDKDVHTKREI